MIFFYTSPLLADHHCTGNLQLDQQRDSDQMPNLTHVLLWRPWRGSTSSIVFSSILFMSDNIWISICNSRKVSPSLHDTSQILFKTYRKTHSLVWLWVLVSGQFYSQELEELFSSYQWKADTSHYLLNVLLQLPVESRHIPLSSLCTSPVSCGKRTHPIIFSMYFSFSSATRWLMRSTAVMKTSISDSIFRLSSDKLFPAVMKTSISDSTFRLSSDKLFLCLSPGNLCFFSKASHELFTKQFQCPSQGNLHSSSKP